MRLRLRRFASMAAGLLTLVACTSLPATGTEQVAGSAVSYAIAGSTGPVVVLQSGLGDDRSPWRLVVPALSSRYTVFSYDRPGYGSSASSLESRDACTIARELHTLLLAARMPPPYVLVGHSLGGLYQYAYARLYPQEVAGLVLVDATYPAHWQRMQQDVPALAGVLTALRATTFSGTERREFDAQENCLGALAATPLAIPTRVLRRSEYGAIEQGAFARLDRELAQDWTRLTGASRVDVVSNSGHYIQQDQPAKVVAAVNAVAPVR
ncbi:alpha/beta fold hydrolase [Jeongeupia chitinilytica]|uniref:Alpha/beta hydrolase n=1 Tax=Jeongeupia chitinilytica TaxID=1041641 RepID=A0ABQ3GVX4_9NEIS|nr:alpha/beta fold hydrolase [Jeongeupia chitinilytica]GHD56942.1 alpha/beta hydrolase [Jeongeupia chitinilytica]